RDLSWLTLSHSRTSSSGGTAGSQEPGVTVRLRDGLPERTLFVSRPDDDGLVHVGVNNGTAQEISLRPGATEQFTHGEYEVSLRYTVGSTEPNVEVVIASKPAPVNRRVLQLDT